MLGNEYLISLKPSPTPLAMKKMDESFVRAEIRRDLEVLKGCHVEIIMKDNNTLGGSKDNAVRWCQLNG